MSEYRMAPGMVGKEATVTPSTTVDGTVKKRRRRGKAKSGRVQPLIVVDSRVMQAVLNARRPGERIEIVSATEVRLVPSR